MNIERSCITNSRSNNVELSELRRSLMAFGEVAKMDDALLLEAAQHIVDEARDELFMKLDGQPDDEQTRYFREVLKTMNHVAGNRLEIPEYETLMGSSKDCRVELKEDFDEKALEA